MNQNFFGGGFSCPSAVVNTLYVLSQHSEILEKLCNVVHELGDTYSFTELENCQLLEQVVRDSLRILPPVPLYFRNVRTAESATLAGSKLPKHTRLIVNYWHLHHDANHWKKPDEFIPSRWDAETIASNPYGSGHFAPFGRGERGCVGKSFALMYIKVTLAMLLRHLRIDVDPTQSYDANFFFGVMMPKHMRATFSQR